MAIFRGEQLMHKWERVSWFMLRERKKGRGRQKLTLIVVKKNMSIKEVTESMTSDWIEWQKILLVADLD